MKTSTMSGLRARLSLLVATLAALLTFGLSAPAQAQIVTETERYAVTDFGVRVPSSDLDLATEARDAIRGALAKVFDNNRETVPVDEVDRAVRELGLKAPFSRPADLIRLGDQLDANYIVTGEVANWRVVEAPGGKQAQVILTVYVRSVSTGIALNGAVITGRSAVRAEDTSVSSMLGEALTDGAFHAVNEMESKILPKGNVLNTIQNEALINRGARSGFRKDTRVIIMRGREQVAEGIVISVDPDSSFVRVTKFAKGVQPGDSVQTVVDVPTVVPVFNTDGTPKTRASRSSTGNQGLFSLVLVLVILGFLFLGGRGSSNDPIGNVLAEAYTPSVSPGVRISWTRDSFFRGNNEGPFRWQVWREGVNTNPVAVAAGSSSFAIDDTLGSNAPGTGTQWDDFDGISGGTTCDFEAPPGGDAPVIPALPTGVPARYRVELVYRVDQNSLPLPPNTSSSGGGTGGGTTGGGTTGGGTTGGGTTGGGTTGGGTTGGGTTGGGTTGGTTGGGTVYCYFATTRVPAIGQATPLDKPGNRGPADNLADSGSHVFSFTSVRNIDPSLSLEYVVQFSPDALFAAGQTVTLGNLVDTSTQGGQQISTSSINTSTLFPNSNFLFWRIGVRNIDDNPGPVADASGKRYIFGGAWKLRRN